MSVKMGNSSTNSKDFPTFEDMSKELDDVRSSLADTGKAIFTNSLNPAQEAPQEKTIKKENSKDKRSSEKYTIKVTKHSRDGVIDLYRKGNHGVTRGYVAEQSNYEKKAAKSRPVTKKWTAEQDEALKKAVKKHNERNWKEIAKEVEGRTHVQCLQRWKKVIRPGLVKGHWSPEEDAILTRLMAEPANVGSWSDVADQIPGRTAKQCRERWCLNINPNINKGPWSEEEDKKLMHYQQILGNKWAEIATHLDGRTENAVKSRYKSLVRAKQKLWTTEEDASIIDLKCAYKFRWNNIAKRMPGRTKNAIRLRWKYLTALDASLDSLKLDQDPKSKETARRISRELSKVAERTTPSDLASPKASTPTRQKTTKFFEEETRKVVAQSTSRRPSASWMHFDANKALWNEPETVYPYNSQDNSLVLSSENRNYIPYGLQSPRDSQLKIPMEYPSSPPMNKKAEPSQPWVKSEGNQDAINDAMNLLNASSGRSWKSIPSLPSGLMDTNGEEVGVTRPAQGISPDLYPLLSSGSLGFNHPVAAPASGMSLAAPGSNLSNGSTERLFESLLRGSSGDFKNGFHQQAIKQEDLQII